MAVRVRDTFAPQRRARRLMREDMQVDERTTCDVVCLSHLPWDLVFQRPHHLMTRAARNGRVLYVEEPREDAQRPYVEVRPAEGGVLVAVPHVPPDLGPAAREDACARLVREAAAAHGLHRVVAWLYTPLWLPAALALQPEAIVYDCMDELSAFAGASSALA